MQNAVDVSVTAMRQQGGQRFVAQFGAGPMKDPFGGAVQCHESAVAIDVDRAVDHVVDDGAVALSALHQERDLLTLDP